MGRRNGLTRAGALRYWVWMVVGTVAALAVACGTESAPAAPGDGDSAGSGPDGLFLSDVGSDAANGSDGLSTDAPSDGQSVSDALAVPDSAVDADIAVSTDAEVEAGADALSGCPGAGGCPCTQGKDCDLGICLDTPGGLQCAKTCTSTCPTGLKCAVSGLPGADDQYICLPAYGWRCDPCTASSQCAAPGSPGAACAVYGLQGAYCGSVCATDADCGLGFSCKMVPLVEGTQAKQCVATAEGSALGVCPCSVRAVSLALGTGCSVDWGDQTVCKGQRTCLQVGPSGPSACNAAKPALEVCNNLDDDCDGKTDEATCDDQNPCTADSCDPKGGAAGSDGCSHVPADNLVCDDGLPCTAGDKCQSGGCLPGPNVCECLVTADCAALEDGDLCNGTLVCDTQSYPYKCKLGAGTAITCDTSGDSACSKATCDPKIGACGPKPSANGAACSDGDDCTVGDACQAGACKAGTSICACKVDADCAGSEDGNLCNGTLLCDVVSHTCKVDPKTLINCDPSADTACSKATCDPKTGACGAKAASNGTTCSDGNACTGSDACTGGTCAGTDISCEDKNPCTDDSCAPASGCLHLANSAPCSDGNACTLADTCKGGQCGAGAPPSCTDKVKDGGETGNDCGGAGVCGLAACPACPAGEACGAAGDCKDGVCSAGTCAQPSCIDKVKNGDETGIDCGGACGFCPTLLLLASGGSTVGGELHQSGPWKTGSWSLPSVDGVDMATGSFGAVAVMRHTKLADLLDNTVQSLSWSEAKGWQAPVTVGTDVLTQGWPAIATVGGGARLAYHGQNFQHYSAVWSGQWAAPAQVGTPASYGPSAPALATLGTDALLVWFDGSNSNHLTARMNSGTDWLSTSDGGSGADYGIPPTALATGATGEALVVWVKPGGQAASQLWSGGAWKAASNIATVLTNSRPALTRDGQGKLWLAFRGQDEKVYLASWSGGVWSAVAPAGSPAFVTKTTPAVAKGVVGNLELAWVDASGAVWHSSRVGMAWSTPAQVATGAKSVVLRTLP